MVLFKKEFHDDTNPDCIVCEKPMRKVFSATPAHFRGNGWGGKR
jgi:predicted nucleic acid-binding Zn ribbon protein